MSSYDLKKTVIQLKTKTKPHSFALYSGEKGDQILITPKRAGPKDLEKIADVVGDKPERRVRGVCLFQNDALAFKTKSKWSTSLETSVVKILRREGLAKLVPPFFMIAGDSEVLDEEDAALAKAPPSDDKALGERIEKLSGGNPKLTKMAEDLRAQVKALRAAGSVQDADEKEAYLRKVMNALVRDPDAHAIAKVDPSAVVATTATATSMPHPRGKNPGYPPEDEYFDAFGQFRDKFRAWVRLVEKGQPKLLDLQAGADQARARFADRKAKGEKLLREGMKNEFPKLGAIAARQPHLNTVVLATAHSPEKERVALEKLSSAEATVRAHVEGVAKAALDIHMLELRDVIDDLEKRRKELQATIDRNVAMATKFLTAALKGPTGIKDLVVGEAAGAAKELASKALAGIFSSKEIAELEKLNKKLDEKKRELKKTERASLEASLNKAKNELTAATEMLYAVAREAAIAQRETGDKFSEMAKIGASCGVSTFKELKEYRKDIQQLWLHYVDASGSIVALLRSSPLVDAYKVANERIKTIKKAQEEHRKVGGEKTDEEALILMDMSTHHKRFADWYYGEFQKYQAVQKELGRNEHLAIIDEALQGAAKSING